MTPLPLALLLPLLLAVEAPTLLWDHGPETRAALAQAGIERIVVPAGRLAEWTGARLEVRALGPEEARARRKLDAPGVDAQVTTLSPTRRPFVVANGWRFRRQPGGRWLYQPSAGAAALAAAEAASFGADALIEAAPDDLEALARMQAFVRGLPAGPTEDLAQIGLFDDGSEQVGEVMTLLARRNLLWRPQRAPDRALAINIRLGTGRYPRRAARDPAELADRIRHEISDEKRLLRVYGSEVVLCRVVGDRRRVRVHLVNYGGVPGAGIRLRLLGRFAAATAYVDEAAGPAPAIEQQVTGGATELTVPRFRFYAVVDLDRRAP